MPAPPQPSPETDRELEELLDEVRRIEIHSRRMVAEVMAGGYASVFRGSGVEFEEVREYAEGDDPRTVDWNVTARMGRPYIKKYRDERDLTVWFVVDLSASMAWGVGTWSPRQMAARVCACLAMAAVRSNDKVGMIAFSDRVEKHVAVGAGLPHALRIVRDCLALPAHGAGTRLDLALQHLGRVARRRSVVFVLSDFAPIEHDRALRLACQKHDVTAVRLIAPEHVAPSLARRHPRTQAAAFAWTDRLHEHGVRRMRLRHPEGRGTRTVDWSSPTVRAAWERQLETHDADLRHRLDRAGADVMDVPIPFEPDRDAVARPILEFFRMRSARGAHG